MTDITGIVKAVQSVTGGPLALLMGTALLFGCPLPRGAGPDDDDAGSSSSTVRVIGAPLTDDPLTLAGAIFVDTTGLDVAFPLWEVRAAAGLTCDKYRTYFHASEEAWKEYEADGDLGAAQETINDAWAAATDDGWSASVGAQGDEAQAPSEGPMEGEVFGTVQDLMLDSGNFGESLISATLSHGEVEEIGQRVAGWAEFTGGTWRDEDFETLSEEVEFRIEFDADVCLLN